MKKSIPTILTILIIGFFISSCSSVEKMIDQGNFDSALTRLQKKIAGKDQIKTKHVQWIEEAFKKVMTRDLARIELLTHSTRSDDWKKIIQLYEKIAYRQEKIAAFLPIISSDGYRAGFSFVNVEKLLPNAIQQHQSLIYEDGTFYLAEGRAGNKHSARTAYDIFDQLWIYADQYKDAKALQEEALNLGSIYVSVIVENHTPEDFPLELEYKLTRNFLNSKWIQYYLEDIDDVEFDHRITIQLHDLSISPEKIREIRYGDIKEIEDGFKYVLDDNGNVLKDTSGNDIKIPVTKKVKAHVIETQLHKSALLVGDLVLESLRYPSNKTISIDSEVIFNHHFAEYRGDFRALSKQSIELVNIGAIPFPDDQALIYDLFEILERKVRSEMRLINFTDDTALAYR